MDESHYYFLLQLEHGINCVVTSYSRYVTMYNHPIRERNGNLTTFCNRKVGHKPQKDRNVILALNK